MSTLCEVLSVKGEGEGVLNAVDVEALFSTVGPHMRALPVVEATILPLHYVAVVYVHQRPRYVSSRDHIADVTDSGR